MIIHRSLVKRSCMLKCLQLSDTDREPEWQLHDVSNFRGKASRKSAAGYSSTTSTKGWTVLRQFQFMSMVQLPGERSLLLFCCMSEHTFDSWLAQPAIVQSSSPVSSLLGKAQYCCHWHGVIKLQSQVKSASWYCCDIYILCQPPLSRSVGCCHCCRGAHFTGPKGISASSTPCFSQGRHILLAIIRLKIQARWYGPQLQLRPSWYCSWYEDWLTHVENSHAHAL